MTDCKRHQVTTRQILYCMGWLLMSLLAGGCERADDETALRMAVETMQAALESRKADTFLEHVADDYSDSNGGDIRALRKLLLFHFLKNKTIHVFITAQQYELQGNLAVITFNATLTGGENLIPERARIYTVRTRWRKQGGRWKIYRAAWE
jgi:ketosteroid isomerase-like protein